MLTLTNRRPRVHITTISTNNELFTNPRAEALGNDQLHKNTAKTDVIKECSNGVCSTTWKPSVMKSSH